MVGLVGLLLAFSVLVTSVLVALREMAERLSPRQIERYTLLASVGSAFWQVLFAAVSYLVTVALFVLVYRFMPKAEVTLRDTLPGAFLAGAVMGNRKVHLCFESSLLSLRSDLWLGRRCRCCADVELCFKLDTAIWRSTHRSLPLRTSSSHG